MTLIHQQGTILSGKEFNDLFKNALKQKERVMLWFHDHPDRGFTAEQIHSFILSEYPLTSVRRCISELYSSGYLKKGEKVMGSYGVMIYTYLKA